MSNREFFCGERDIVSAASFVNRYHRRRPQARSYPAPAHARVRCTDYCGVGAPK